MAEELNPTSTGGVLAETVLSLYSRALSYTQNFASDHIRSIEPAISRDELIQRLTRTRDLLLQEQDRLKNVALVFTYAMDLGEKHVETARRNDFAFSETLSFQFPEIPPTTFMNAEYSGDLSGALSAIDIALGRLLPSKEVHESAFKRLGWRMRAIRRLVIQLMASIEHTVDGDHGRQAIVDLDVLNRLEGFTKRDIEDLDSDKV